MPDPGSRPRVVVFTASMGGGHMQISRELERRFTALGWAATVVDMLDLTPRWGRFVSWFYPWMINRAPWLYGWIYRRFFLAPQSRAQRASIPVRLSMRGLRRLVEAEDPDLVVSTYHLAGVAAARLREAGDLRAPAVTLITTFATHDLWLHPGTDLYLCITDRVAHQVRERTSAPVRVCEPVVRPGFAYRPGTARSLTAGPGGRRGERVALVVAGSLGMGPIEEAVRVVADLAGWQPVVVCGRNERLRDRLSSIPGARVMGWTDDMSAVMAAADVLIDNAGGSTAKEALSMGRPVITFRPIAGHGRHDASMMAEVGAGEVVDDPEELVEALDRLSTPEPREARIAAGRALFGTDPAGLLIEWLHRSGAAPAA